MASEFEDIPVEALAVAVVAIAEAHDLSVGERARLFRAVTGAIPGNRDRPVFLLAVQLCAAGLRHPLELIIPGQGGLGRLDAAFLDFLVTVAVNDTQEFDRLLAAFDAAPQQPDPARTLASALSRVLHGYRSRVLPQTRYHNLFTAIRRFYARYRPAAPDPRDGDALAFWEAEATRVFLTRYVTALNGLADYADAARLAASWRFGVSLDDEALRSLPDGAGAEMSDDDPVAPERLQESLSVLSAAPVKLLLAREIEEIGAVAAISGPARRWPRDMMAALGFGPVQNAITEAIRRGSGPPDLSSHVDRAESYAELRARHRLLNDKLMDALHLIRLGRLADSERAAARSSLPADRRKRIEAMERRRSYAEMDDANRGAALMALVEPLLTVRALVEAVCASWEGYSLAALEDVQRDHRARFRAKTDNLYAEQAMGQAAGVAR